MSIPGSLTPLFSTGSSAAAAAYQVSRSLRFNSSDTAFLNRTPAVAGDRTKWTWAGWVKRSELGRLQMIFCAGPDTANDTDQIQTYFTSSDTFGINSQNTQFRITTQVFRDVSAWYHFVIAVDTTIASPANDRIKLYINGSQVTTFNVTANPTQNANTGINATTQHTFGRSSGVQYISSAESFSGYLAETYLIDGQALTPSNFTEVSATTGQLIPKAYSGGSYGTNGFYLQFADNSSNTAATLGKDTSGNSNNWTPNNLSVTAGAGNDSLVDTPTSISATDTGVGGEIRGNYATLNPLFVNAGVATLSNGNLDYTTASGSYAARFASIGMSSGKWYAEFTFSVVSGGQLIGIANNPPASITFVGDSASGYSYAQGGQKYTNGGAIAYGASYTNGDIIGIAFDADAGTLVFYKNGSSQGTAFSSIAAGSYFFGISGSNGTTGSWNFGQRPFAYQTPGTNRPAATFLALCDTNLGAPVVAKPNTLFDVVTRTFTGASASITSLAFAPDFLWFKRRNDAASHSLFDSVRGVSGRLLSNGTNAEITVTDALTSFDSNGFTLGVDSGSISVNGPSSGTGVVWAWDAGTSTVSNTAGSITSQVRANASAGFSVVKYPNVGSTNSTIGHGLGVAPKLVIVRYINQVSGWYTYHADTGAGKYLELQATDSATTLSSMWNNTAPTSTVFSVGTAWTSSIDTLAYCFAPVDGYSSAFTYNANGSNDGPMVYLGFRPRFILLKSTNISGTEWMMWDAARGDYNVVNPYLLANRSNAEGSTGAIDFLSNGFKLRNISDSWNNSGATGTYVGFAWAESPFQYARAR